MQGRAKMPRVLLSRPVRVLLVPKLFSEGTAPFPRLCLALLAPREGVAAPRGFGFAVPGSVRSPPGQDEQLPGLFVSQVSAICAGRLVCRTKGFVGAEGL